MRMTLWLLVAVAGVVGMTVALLEDRFGLAFLLFVVSMFASGLASRARDKSSPHSEPVHISTPKELLDQILAEQRANQARAEAEISEFRRRVAKITAEPQVEPAVPTPATDQKTKAKTDQEATTGEILEFLGAFDTNLKQLLSGLEGDDPLKVKTTLAVLVDQDLGHRIAGIFGLTDPSWLERLVDPLKRIEADLTRAEPFAGEAASPTLQAFVGSKLMVVKSALSHVRKTVGG